ncbi:MAG: hypothetical protein H0V44_07045 [Planctomycetes bacterium]|nr:hypothetical protein [Planctomycetota bacterium]
MRLHSLVLGFAIILLLAACGGPRVKPISRSAALSDPQPREMRVVKVWDQVTEGMDLDRDENISHLIEVEITDGPEKGTVMTLPYDEWNVGQRPPRAGDRVVLAPADWVKRSATSTGRPYGGW